MKVQHSGGNGRAIAANVGFNRKHQQHKGVYDGVSKAAFGQHSPGSHNSSYFHRTVMQDSFPSFVVNHLVNTYMQTNMTNMHPALSLSSVQLRKVTATDIMFQQTLPGFESHPLLIEALCFPTQSNPWVNATQNKETSQNTIRVRAVATVVTEAHGSTWIANSHCPLVVHGLMNYVLHLQKKNHFKCLYHASSPRNRYCNCTKAVVL